MRVYRGNEEVLDFASHFLWFFKKRFLIVISYFLLMKDGYLSKKLNRLCLEIAT